MHKASNFLKIFHSGIFSLVFLLFATAIAFGQATGGVKGKVRNARGEAVSGVEITARRDSHDIRSAKTNSKGEFNLAGLQPGIYNFVFDVPGYNSAIRYKIEIKANKTTDLGDRLVLVVDKGTLVIVQGSVFFKDGRSVPGAKVIVEKVDQDGSTKEVATLYTNITGEFTFRQPEGNAKFRLTAKYKDSSVTKELEVDSAAIYRLAISLDTDK